jgi:hypothetical protein
MSLGSLFNPPDIPAVTPPPRPEDPAEVFRRAIRRQGMNPNAGTRQALTVDPATGISVQQSLISSGNALPGQVVSPPTIPTQMFPR